MSCDEKNLECLFTWEIEKTVNHRFQEYNGGMTSIEDQPVIALMNKLTDVYNMITKGDDEEITTNLVELVTLRDTIDTSLVARRLIQENISLEVLKHITNSTFYYIYNMGDNKILAKRMFDDLTDSNQLISQTELATFHGCKSIVLSSFHHKKQALKQARKAVTYSPDCPLWHLSLCKALEKRDTFEEYQNESNAIISTCTKMLMRAYQARLQGTEVLSRLTSAFVDDKKLELAGECLNRLELQCQNKWEFLHYKGSYLKALGFYKEAAWHYKLSAKFGYYRADIQYIRCSTKIDRQFDVIRHLNVMIIKYADKHYTQLTLLYLAMQYERNKKFEEACEHFVKAIKIDNKSYLLKKFRNRLITRDKKPLNIFHYIKYKFIKKCGHIDSILVQQLRDLCD